MKKKQTYIGILSVLAMFTIAFSNVSSDIWNSLSKGDSSWNLYAILSISTKWALPLLVALFGILFLDNDMMFSTVTVYRRFLPAALIGCVLWWVVNSLVHLRSNFTNELDIDTFLECMGEVIYEPYMVCLLQLFVALFAFYPLISRIARNSNLLVYALVVTFVISMLLPAIENIPYVRYINLFTNQINWNFFSSYGFYIFFGIWICKTEFDWHHRIVSYCAAVLSTVAMYVLTNNFSASIADVDTRFININSPFIVFQVLAVVVFVKQIFKNNSKNKMFIFIMGEVSDNLYGFIALGATFNNYLSRCFTAFYIPLVSLVVINIACAILRRIPVFSYLLCSFRIKEEN